MKIMIVAHPDDEIIWFEPVWVDLIIVVFSARADSEFISKKRAEFIKMHPLGEKCLFMAMDEIPNQENLKAWERVLEKYIKEYIEKRLNLLIPACAITDVFTHGPMGEYGHPHHILIHDVVKKIFKEKNTVIWAPNLLYAKKGKVLIIRRNMNLYRELKKLYVHHNIWTWKDEYLPSQYESFYQVVT
ncbi:MAG: hypothetical protein KBD63_07965 [Bacteriovoracaceae bacterium]|nr:hypothetical protein [Bacteriovoracaceae bacterium]